MSVRKIYSESPGEDQWQLILRYAYPHNIFEYLKNNGISDPDDNLVENISGSILQAKEYYDASKMSSLHVAPLLLYYGTSNLLFGIANLIKGKVHHIDDHGMKLKKPKPSMRICDIEIKTLGKKSGALSVFDNVFSNGTDLPNSGLWKNIELLGSIPDLLEEFLSCYDDGLPFTIPVEIVKDKKSDLERVAYSSLGRYASVDDAFSNVNNFSANYLSPQETGKYIILRYRVNSSDIGIYSIAGQKYLPVSHKKNTKLYNPSLELIIFMVLFSLGFVSRYHPEIWTPFTRNDTTGEKLVIEKLLNYVRRQLPNLVLSRLYNEKLLFVTEQMGLLDLTNSIDKTEVEEIARQEIQKFLDRQRM